TLTRDGPTLDEKRDAEQAMSDAFNLFAEFLKSVLDFDPNDARAVSELNQEWDQLLRHWQPEYRHRDSWLVDALERERGPADPEGDPPQLPPIRRLGIHLQVERPADAIARVLADESIRSALPHRADERAEKLAQALEALVARVKQDEEDATIAAPLDQETIDR